MSSTGKCGRRALTVIPKDTQELLDVFDVWIDAFNCLLEADLALDDQLDAAATAHAARPQAIEKASSLTGALVDKLLMIRALRELHRSGRLTWLQQMKSAQGPGGGSDGDDDGRRVETGRQISVERLKRKRKFVTIIYPPDSPHAPPAESDEGCVYRKTFTDLATPTASSLAETTAPYLPPTNCAPLLSQHHTIEWPPPLPPIENPDILQQVFSHRSFYANKEDRHGKTYERLEFLGDTYLNTTVSRILFAEFPNYQEGDLTQARSQIVRNDNLSSWGKLYDMDKRMRISLSAEADGVRLLPKKIADCFEAYVAGVILDSENGKDHVDSWLSALVKPMLKQFKVEELAKSLDVDFPTVSTNGDSTISLSSGSSAVGIIKQDQTPPRYKAKQKLYVDLGNSNRIRYEVVEQQSDGDFFMVCLIDGVPIAYGKGRGKQAAGQVAAQKAQTILFPTPTSTLADANVTIAKLKQSHLEGDSEIT